MAQATAPILNSTEGAVPALYLVSLGVKRPCAGRVPSGMWLEFAW